MPEWTQIGFSSIYFVLSKLQKLGLVAAKKVGGKRRGRGIAIQGLKPLAIPARRDTSSGRKGDGYLPFRVRGDSWWSRRPGAVPPATLFQAFSLASFDFSTF